MILGLSIMDRSHFFGNGYIAGTGNGVVTVGGVPAIRPVFLFCFEAGNIVPKLVAQVFSNKNGEYLFYHLDTNKKYTAMCRDLPPDGINERYEPFCWDYVTPMMDLTLDEQRQLWQQITES